MPDRRTFLSAMLALVCAPSLAKFTELTQPRRRLTPDEAIRLLEPKLRDIWVDAYGPTTVKHDDLRRMQRSYKPVEYVEW